MREDSLSRTVCQAGCLGIKRPCLGHQSYPGQQAHPGVYSELRLCSGKLHTVGCQELRTARSHPGNGYYSHHPELSGSKEGRLQPHCRSWGQSGDQMEGLCPHRYCPATTYRATRPPHTEQPGHLIPRPGQRSSG